MLPEAGLGSGMAAQGSRLCQEGPVFLCLSFLCLAVWHSKPYHIVFHLATR